MMEHEKDKIISEQKHEIKCLEKENDFLRHKIEGFKMQLDNRMTQVIRLKDRYNELKSN